MADIDNIHWRSVQGRFGDVTYQITQVQFFPLRSARPWCPSINAYQCREGYVICVDLAGVDRGSIDLHVEPRRVILRGRRNPLEPPSSAGVLTQVLALEIDQGPFERALIMPAEIATAGVKAEQRDGIFWIFLPTTSTSL